MSAAHFRIVLVQLLTVTGGLNGESNPHGKQRVRLLANQIGMCECRILSGLIRIIAPLL